MPILSESVLPGAEMRTIDLAPALKPLLQGVVGCYIKHHPQLAAIYVIGSVALGELREGVSDLDVIGVVNGPILPAADSARRRELVQVGRHWPVVSFVDNTAFNLQELEWPEPSLLVRGHASKLALSGVRIWGEPLDLSNFYPTLDDMVYGRAERARALMRKYRSGNVIEPFRRDRRLLTRSCAKAAMRVISAITLMRSAPYHSSPYQTAQCVSQYAPEAQELAQAAMAILANPTPEAETAAVLVDAAIDLLYALFPHP